MKDNIEVTINDNNHWFIELLKIAVVPISIVIYSQYFTNRQNENEINLKYIEIATSILKDKPTESNKELRAWAVNIINKYSPPKIKLNKNVQQSLINKIPLNGEEILKYNLTGEYTFKWLGNPEKGYEIDVQIYDDNKWINYSGQSVVGNQTKMIIPTNQRIRWKVSEYGKKKTNKWFYINPTIYNNTLEDE